MDRISPWPSALAPNRRDCRSISMAVTPDDRQPEEKPGRAFSQSAPSAGLEPGKYPSSFAGGKDQLSPKDHSFGSRPGVCRAGLPRQEVWAYEFRDLLPMPILAVGAAFTFIAGELRQAPLWMQNNGLEGVFRFCMEPRRLWRRYVLMSPAYVVLLTLQALGLKSFTTEGKEPAVELLHG